MLKTKSLLVCFVFLFSFFYSDFSLKANQPTKDELFKQQLRIYELNRDITKIHKQVVEIDELIPSFEEKIEKEEVLLEKEKEKVKALLLDYYSGEQWIYADIMMSSESLSDVLTFQYVAKKNIEKDLKVVENLDNDLQSFQKTVDSLEKSRKKLKELHYKLKEDLKKIKEAEKRFKYELGMVSDVENAKKDVKAFISNWENEGLPSFQTFFKTLTKTIQELPEVVDKSNIQSKGLFTHQVVLKDQELNEFLRNRNDIFKKTSFEFLDDKLLVHGQHKGMSLMIEGHYQLISKKEMQFYIDRLVFNGIELPSVTIDDMQNRYNLGFYPSKIFPGAKINDVIMKEGKLIVEVSL